MPGNEVGERIHNFFGQDNLSQDQHQSQVGGTWPGFGNGLWVGSQRQSSSPLIPNSKNHSVQPTVDSERGQSSSVQHGLNHSQPASRHDFSRSQSQYHQPPLNGYLHENQGFTKNEANFLGADTDSGWHGLTSRGISVTDSQQESGPDPHKNNYMRLDASESPVNYDFFGGQQQSSSQQTGMLQSLQKQQVDTQLLHQQVMFKQFEDLQRQQQLQNHQLLQRDARQLGSSKQSSAHYPSGLISGVPVQDTSNYPWQAELMSANSNSLQHGATPLVQGSSSGLMFSPEQGQAHMMGLVPQQFEQSLYGVPVTSTRGNINNFSSNQINKPAVQNMSASSNSFSGNQYAAFPNTVNMQSNGMFSRQGYQQKSMFGPGLDESNRELNLENLQHMGFQQRNESGQDFSGRPEVAGPSKKPNEKTSSHVTPSESVATLDPTEEKILFGSDDNLWEAFGSDTNMTSGGCSILGGSDILGTYPSMQSGRWSALMQSAVGETSGSDTRLHDGWSSMSVRNSEPSSANQQPSAIHDDDKQHMDKKPNPIPVSVSDNIIAGFSCHSAFGGQQPGLMTRGERFRTDTSRTSGHRFPGEGSKSVDPSSFQNPPREGSQRVENISHASDADFNAESCSDRWVNQQKASAHSSNVKPGITPNGWNFIESGPLSGGVPSKGLGNDRVQSFRGSDVKSTMSRGTEMWNAAINSNAALERHHTNSLIHSTKNNMEGSDINCASAVKDSISAKDNHENSQQLPNNHNLNIVNNAESPLNSRSDGPSKTYQHHLDKSFQTLEASGNHGSDGGALDLHDMPNLTKENARETSSFNPSQPSSSHGDNVWSNSSDSHALPGREQTAGHAGRRPSVPRKFQYHPMGNLDVNEDPSFGTRNSSYSLPFPQQGSGEEQLGQPKYLGHGARNYMENEKGHLFQGDYKCENGVPPRGTHPGSAPSMPASVERPVGSFRSSKASPSSQNMLELLHKVDQSGKQSIETHFNSSDRTQNKGMPEAHTSGVSGGRLHHNQSSASQGFGLQLALSSQRLPTPDHPLVSQSSTGPFYSTGSGHMTSQIRGKSQPWLAAATSSQSSPSREIFQGQYRNVDPSISEQARNNVSQYNNQENAAFTSGVPFPRNSSQSQHMTDPGGHIVNNQSANGPLNRFASHENQDYGGRSQNSQSEAASSMETFQQNMRNHNHARDAAQDFPVFDAMSASQPSIVSGLSEQISTLRRLPNSGGNTSAEKSQMGTQYSKPHPDLLKPHLQSSKNLEAFSSGQQKMDQISQEGGGASSEVPASLANLESEKQQQLSRDNDRLSGASPSVPVTQRDLETSGRSLAPSTVSSQNYSLLRQMQAMKSAEFDPANRSSKRLKGPENVFPSGSNMLAQDALTNRTLVASEEANMLGDVSNKNTSAHDMLGISRNETHSFCNGDRATAVRADHIQISPQMAPSWFNQYGTLKNGEVLPTYDAQRPTSDKTTEQAFIVGRPLDSLHAHQTIEQNAVITSQHGIQQGSSNMLISSVPLSSSQLLPPDTTDQSSIVARGKNQKVADSGLLPWSKEVTHSIQRLQNISGAEVEWARAANRLAEKLEDHAELIEDVSPVLRSKRRLIMTTQLMQQLLHPPPVAVLSSDASSNYESVVYVSARVASGDACNTLSSSRSSSLLPPDPKNTPSEKLKKNQKSRDQYVSKAMEDFHCRAKKLEKELFRSDKGTSIADLRLESQDLERFSVINRFARYHGRGQNDGSDDANVNWQKCYPQRYVTALPMPRDVPDTVQCLSL